MTVHFPFTSTITAMSTQAQSTQDNSALFAAIAKAADKYPKPQGVTFGYGTAGFRTLYVSATAPVCP